MAKTLKSQEKLIENTTLYLCRSCNQWLHWEQMCDKTHCRQCNGSPIKKTVDWLPIRITQNERFFRPTTCKTEMGECFKSIVESL